MHIEFNVTDDDIKRKQRRLGKCCSHALMQHIPFPLTEDMLVNGTETIPCTGGINPRKEDGKWVADACGCTEWKE